MTSKSAPKAHETTRPTRTGTSMVLDRTTGTLRARTYRITVTEGPDAGESRLLNGPTRVGKGRDNALVLTDATVSRHHLELTPRATGVLVQDLQSRNGTFVGTMRVESVLLGDDAVLRLGKTVLALHTEEEVVPLNAAKARRAFGEAIGTGPAMQRIFALLERLAQVDSTVLLCGESGTGKDLLARSIHDASARAKGPFKVFDCASASAELVESELFGHAAGAFTGAGAARRGVFLNAEGGTLYLDAVDELPLEAQRRVLRVVDTGLLRRVGGDEEEQVDVRVIASTQHDLSARVAEKKFRQDLYFRLAILVLDLPPLRDRAEDVLPLADLFAERLGKPALFADESNRLALRARTWPGNVRELRALVERAAALGLPAASARPAVPAPTQYKDAREAILARFTKEYLVELHRAWEGNLSAMARAAGIERHYLRKLLQQAGLRNGK